MRLFDHLPPANDPDPDWNWIATVLLWWLAIFAALALAERWWG